MRVAYSRIHSDIQHDINAVHLTYEISLLLAFRHYSEVSHCE
jgi:hypothetical protein